jgi:phosphoglycolate phosphatase
MRLVIFDCDGTIIDSQHAILAAMTHAFDTVGLRPPSREDILGVVGLSLPEAFAVLAGQYPRSVQAELASLYRSDFPRFRMNPATSEPLYPGIRETIEALAARDDVVLGIATGKSKRGVARLFDRESWHGHFMTVQTADDHPSKPHPSMILQAMMETGAAVHSTVMVGDTSFDMEMARNAEVRALGVGWGYHSLERLAAAGAHALVHPGGDLLTAIEACLLGDGAPA